jgi:DNA-binding beta-propeller fold protein YncE
VRTWITRSIVSITAVIAAGLSGTSAAPSAPLLPNGWVLEPAHGMTRETDTMPQGAAASPDGSLIAVVDSGFNVPTLRVYDPRDLKQTAVIPLKGAFGRPVWIDSKHVLVAADNDDSIFDIDVSTQHAERVPLPAKSHPVAIAHAPDGTIAVSDDGDGSVRFGALAHLAAAAAVHIGQHPGRLVFTSDSRTLYVADRSGSSVAAVDVSSHHVRRIATGLHPSDVLVAHGELYVAASDDDVVGTYDAGSGRHIADIFLGDTIGGERVAGASPNAIAVRGGDVYVSLGAANEVAVLRHDRVIAKLATGWYPTDVVPIGGRLFVFDGKGERARPNPQFNAKSRSFNYYVASIEFGSIRTIDVSSIPGAAGNPQGAVGWQNLVPDSVIRPNGPIRHVFFILKENRSYDEVLGDMPEGNGDSSLVWFGAAVTPNQHALAKRFGLFDNAYTSGEVSDAGHNWSVGAFANDYVERVWPPTYGGRRDDDDVTSGAGAQVAHNGFIWDAAAAAHVTFRDYGEMTNVPGPGQPPAPPAPTLRGLYDPKYVGFDLDYSDALRVREWSREFDAFLKAGTLPQFEYLWLPNDHTFGSRPGKLTPVALVAQNDYAVGSLVEKISHSSVWKSSAIFIIEDDSQDGADHVSDQRTTLYLASPYARGGVIHDHYSTTSVLRTIELILGMKPLSTYDAMAVPMYDAFTATLHPQPYQAVRPQVDMTAKNPKSAYGAKVSAELDFSRPDTAPPGLLLDILAHNRTATPIARTFVRRSNVRATLP